MHGFQRATSERAFDPRFREVRARRAHASGRAALTDPSFRRSALAAARAALSEDASRGADAARRAVGDSVRRLEAAYFSGRALSGADAVFPTVLAASARVVRAAAAPPLLAFLRPEQLPPDLAPYRVLDAQGLPAPQQ